jgi:hypothetical protein
MHVTELLQVSDSQQGYIDIICIKPDHKKAYDILLNGKLDIYA